MIEEVAIVGAPSIELKRVAMREDEDEDAERARRD